MSPPPHWPHVSHYSSISPSFPVWHIWELVNQKKEEKRVSKWGTLGLTMWYCDNSHFQIYPGKQYYNDCEKHGVNNKKFRSLIKIVPQIFFHYTSVYQLNRVICFNEYFCDQCSSFKTKAPVFLTFFPFGTGSMTLPLPPSEGLWLLWQIRSCCMASEAALRETMQFPSGPL